MFQVRSVLPSIPRWYLLWIRREKILRAWFSRFVRSMLQQVWRICNWQSHQSHGCQLASTMFLLSIVPQGAGRQWIHPKSKSRIMPFLQRSSQSSGNWKVRLCQVSRSYRWWTASIPWWTIPWLPFQLHNLWCWTGFNSQRSQKSSWICCQWYGGYYFFSIYFTIF